MQATEAQDAFRRHFDAGELARIDSFGDKLGTLLAQGLFTRKLEKWSSVAHFRMTQLATVDGFGLSHREIAKIKGAYFHAQDKAEREADKILSRSAIPSPAPAATHAARPKPVDMAELAAEIHTTLAELSASPGDGNVHVFEKRAIWRFIATHVVLATEIDDPEYMEAAGTLMAIDRELDGVSDDTRQRVLLLQARDAEDRVDTELERLLEAYRLADLVDEMQASMLTDDPAKAAL